MDSKEELQAIFQEDTNMDVLMNTGFTSTISMEKKVTIVRYRPVQYPKMCFIIVLFRAVAFCVLCQLWFAVAKFYDSPKLSMMILPNFPPVLAWINPYIEHFVCVTLWDQKQGATSEGNLEQQWIDWLHVCFNSIIWHVYETKCWWSGSTYWLSSCKTNYI